MKRNTNRNRGAVLAFGQTGCAGRGAGLLARVYGIRREAPASGSSAGLCCLVILGLLASAPANAQTTVLTNATVIDATGAPPIEDAAVVIDGNRIAAIHTPSASAPDPGDDARVIDLGGAYVLPGLWNNHSHLGDLLPDPKGLLRDEPLPRAMIRAGRNAMDALKAGFTTLRITGERDFMDVAWKKAFDDGVFIGPRIVAGGPPLSTDGDTDWLVRTGKGLEGIRAVVADNIANGAQLIKFLGSRMPPEQMIAGIEEAHRHGIPVTVHAGDETTRIAVMAGAESIEHGNDLSDDTIRMMAEAGTFLDPTIQCNLSTEFIAARERLIAEAGYIAPPEVVEGRVRVSHADERSPAYANHARDVINKAYAAGVRLTTGSDSNPISEIGILEIEQFVFHGIPPMGAIQAATRNSAEMMGMLDDLGTVEAGKLADLIVLEKNPLEHISHMRSLSMVIKDGKIVNRSPHEGQASFWELYLQD